MHVWSFWAEYWPIWSIWCYAEPIKQCERGASLVSWYVYTRTFAPSKVIMMFGPKTAIFAPKYAFFGTYRPCWLIWYPAGWLVGSCGAGAVSRKTPIHFLGPRGALYYLWLTRPQWKIWIPCIKAGMPHELSEDGGGGPKFVNASSEWRKVENKVVMKFDFKHGAKISCSLVQK